MKRCIIWIASGEKYIKEAMVSMASAKAHNPDLPRILCADIDRQRLTANHTIDRIIELPPRMFEWWYLDCVSYLNQAINELKDFEEILLLDTDTFVCHSLDAHFDILERVDIAGSHPPGRVTTQTLYEIPASFPELHVGALAFRNKPIIWGLFNSWLYLFTQNRQIYGNNDQGPLRDALWICPSIHCYPMPPEFCFRFPFGGLLRGRCRVLHGRSNRTYQEIEEIVNADWRKIRTFPRGFVRK